MSTPPDPNTPAPPIATQNSEPNYGCIPYDKTNTVVINGGAPTTMEFQIRDSNGAAVDLSYWFPPDVPAEELENALALRFAFADNSIVAKRDVVASVIDPANGKIQVELPEYVYDMPCIYFFYSAVREKTEEGKLGGLRHAFPGRGVLLVEWSPWMVHLKHCPVRHRTVPTLEDVRRKLDDFVSKNTLLNQYEFSADDIVHAMIHPVYLFNEEPPRLRRFHYTLTTFPFYDNWVIGTAAELLQIALMHYVRNKMHSNHGGIQGDEKSRDKEYMQIMLMYKEEYRQWVRRKKWDLNYSMGQGWGTIHSEYSRFG
jgi:hypothetical protein